MAVTITKDTIIGDILDIAPETAPLFMAIGMHCLGCPASRGETVEEACMVHGIEVEELLDAKKSDESFDAMRYQLTYRRKNGLCASNLIKDPKSNEKCEYKDYLLDKTSLFPPSFFIPLKQRN